MLDRRTRLTPQLKTYYEVRWDKLIEELRQISRELGRDFPIPPRRERRIALREHVDVTAVEW